MGKQFIWDRYSDQPYPLRDKAYKRKMRRKHGWSMLPLLAVNLTVMPLALMAMPFLKRKREEEDLDFYGMGVTLDKGDAQYALVEELGVKHLLIRMPLWEMDRVDEYVAFAKGFGKQQILLNILQDREHIEDHQLLERDMRTIFEKFGSFVHEYQIGNAVNRTKWGFFSMDEYLKWYGRIQALRDAQYPELKMIGSSVIDFEYHYTARTLFNRYKVYYDRFSALLYVDRRGTPKNTQYGFFDTRRKINLLYSLVRLSPKSSDTIYITEVNWPLQARAPYAPTSERECVSEETYAAYMEAYHDIARKSGKIARVYWHQLIAPGYGLVDDRGGKIRKMPAFERYKRMIENAHT